MIFSLKVFYVFIHEKTLDKKEKMVYNKAAAVRGEYTIIL
jgi:hypothetical protein